MKRLELEQLLGDEHEKATFHDAILLHASIDYAKLRIELRFQIPIGIRGHNLLYRRGILALSGLQFFAVTPPAESYSSIEPAGAWITADGSLPNPAVELGVQLPMVSEDSFVHYFFASDWNAFLVVAAETALFTWSE
jgi:hypothetical protein